MCRKCRDRFPCHRGLAIPTCFTARASRTCRDACRDRQLAVSFEDGGGRNVPGIPGAYATRNYTYLVGGPWMTSLYLWILVYEPVVLTVCWKSYPRPSVNATIQTCVEYEQFLHFLFESFQLEPFVPDYIRVVSTETIFLLKISTTTLSERSKEPKTNENIVAVCLKWRQLQKLLIVMSIITILMILFIIMTAMNSGNCNNNIHGDSKNNNNRFEQWVRSPRQSGRYPVMWFQQWPKLHQHPPFLGGGFVKRALVARMAMAIRATYPLAYFFLQRDAFWYI